MKKNADNMICIAKADEEVWVDSDELDDDLVDLVPDDLRSILVMLWINFSDEVVEVQEDDKRQVMMFKLL